MVPGDPNSVLLVRSKAWPPMACTDSSAFLVCILARVTDAHVRARVNGRVLYVTYLHTNGWWWKDTFVNQIANIPTNQQFWFEVNAGCNRNAAHSWGQHQRVEVEYTGARRAADV